MKQLTSLFLTTALLMLISGCQGYRLPIGPPGTINEQRNRAAIFDPFPETDIGPDIIGGRPREFDRPLPEAERVPLYRDTYGKR